MRLDFDDLGKPILKIDQNGVVIVIAFADIPLKENIKRTVLDFLTVAHEKRMSVK